jgi:hypothetical protein
LEPFEQINVQDNTRKFGFITYGAEHSYEFWVPQQTELEKVLDILYPKVIILGLLEDFTDFQKIAVGNFGTIFRAR